MIGTLFTLTNKSGDSVIINDHLTNPSRFIALQSYPAFDVEIKNNELGREGQHGVWDFFSYYGRRSIGFQGVIVGDTEEDVEAVKKQLQKVVALPLNPATGEDGYIYVRWTDLDGNDWEIECKLMNSIQFSRNLKERYRLDFNLSLKAPYPYILSQESTVTEGIRGFETEGASFPLELPALLSSGYLNMLVVENNGDVDAHTVIRIYGESTGTLTNPRVINTTTGKGIYLSHSIADETEYVEIDSLQGTIIDQDGVDVSGTITGDSEFITLVPGDNNIVYITDEVTSATAVYTVTHRDAKI